MHRKRVTSELHDSYFRLMTIKHSISKIQWAIVLAFNYYIIELSSGCQGSCQQTSRQLETRCGKESHTRPRGPSETPDGVDPNIKRTRKTQRDGHNSGVKIWSLCLVSSTLSHANLEQPFRTLAIKWEVNIFLKKSSMRPSFLRLYRCVVVMLHERVNAYITGVRNSIDQSWLAKGLELGLLCWGFKGVQEEIPSEEASTLQIGSVAFPAGQCTSLQLHPYHRLFDQDGHQDSSSTSL